MGWKVKGIPTEMNARPQGKNAWNLLENPVISLWKIAILPISSNRTKGGDTGEPILTRAL
ncbi:MAG: hypothetical protein NZ992_02420 [Candidatus Korarchaeum sp.]|nr:hypothetical protein [Candidatus Korarchaeum sp.]MDW8036055.1 hypothetical protein [Candidatus Korarchaeum sp.]